MMNDKKVVLNILVVPTCWVVGGITALILGLCKLDWMSYLIGLFTGLLSFGMMVKSSRRMARLAELEPGVGMAKAKSSSWKGASLRLLVVGAVFAALFFKEKFGNPDANPMWVLIYALCGYMTVKVVLIAVYLIFRKKVESA